MGNFSLKSKDIFITNKSGHIAYKMDHKEKLILEVLTNLFNEKEYYGDNSSETLRDIREVIKEDSKFVSNLCIYARKEMHLRTISHVICGELANSEHGKPYVRKVINSIVCRADDMTEILSYYLNAYEKPIPNSLKEGISDCFLKFDEYSLAKDNRKGDVELRDIISLVYQTSKIKKQSDRFKRILEGKLEIPKASDVKVLTEGDNNETWEELIESGKLCYMSMLRNLRNIIRDNPNNINRVYEELSEEKRVLTSKQQPFRYYSAYKVLKNEGLGTSKLYDSLEDAIKIATKNLPYLKGRTLISADVTESMSWTTISKGSEVTCAEIAVLMVAMSNYICEEAITTTFDTNLYHTPMSRRNGIISNANSIKLNGGGTNISLPLQYLLEDRIYVDRIIIISDNELNLGYERECQLLVEKYKNQINPNVWIHAIDLHGYGTQQFKGENVNIITGWSEKTLEFISKVEDGAENLSEKIEEYYFK